MGLPSSGQVFSTGTVAAYSAKYNALPYSIQNIGTVPILKFFHGVATPLFDRLIHEAVLESSPCLNQPLLQFDYIPVTGVHV